MDQLAAHHEQITQLDAREAAHFAALTSQLTELADLATQQPDDDPTGYQPDPAPPWWKLAAADRAEPLARLRAWVEQVYRPGYGHLAATLGALLGSPRPVPVRPGHRRRACGRSCTSSPTAPPACCRPRPSTRPASCPPWPPS